MFKRLHMFASFLFAVLLCGCPTPETAAPAKKALHKKPVNVSMQASGVVVSCVKKPNLQSNLTHNEARLTVTANAPNTHLWIELWPIDASETSRPTSAGQGGEAIFVPPGEYKLQLTYRRSELLTGLGHVQPVVIPPATHAALELTTALSVATVIPRFTANGEPLSRNVTITLKSSTLPEQNISAETPLSLSPGEYTLQATYEPVPGHRDSLVRTLNLKHGDNQVVSHDFKLALSRVTFRLKDASSSVLKRGQLQIQSIDHPGLSYSTQLSTPVQLTSGKHKVTFIYADGPMVDINQVSIVLVSDEPEQNILIKPTPRVGLLTVQTLVDGEHTQCRVTLTPQGQGASAAQSLKSKTVKLSPALPLPAGTWNIRLNCGEKRVRDINGLRLRNGEHVRRTVRF